MITGVEDVAVGLSLFFRGWAALPRRVSDSGCKGTVGQDLGFDLCFHICGGDAFAYVSGLANAIAIFCMFYK